MLKSVYCPICILRLFDAKEGAKAEIEIKCSRCRNLHKFKLGKVKLETTTA